MPKNYLTGIHQETAGIALAIASALGWSMTGIFVKLLPALSPWMIVSARCFVAFFIALGFTLLQSKKRNFSEINNKENWLLAILMMCYYVTAVSAYQLTSVAEVAILLNTSPMFAIGIRIYRGGAVARKEWIGTGVGLVGLLIIMLPEFFTGNEINLPRLSGGLLALVCSYLVTLYAVRIEHASARGVKVSISSITLLTYLFGAVFMLLFTLFFDGADGLGKSIGTNELWLLIGLGVVSTLIPSVTFGLAAKKINTVKLTTIRLLIPVFASLLAFLILSETPVFWVIPGGVLIIAGVLIGLKDKEKND